MMKNNVKITTIAIVAAAIIGFGSVSMAQESLAQATQPGKNIFVYEKTIESSPDSERMQQIVDLIRDENTTESQKNELRNEIDQINERVTAPVISAEIKAQIDDRKEVLTSHLGNKLSTMDAELVMIELPIVFIGTAYDEKALRVGIDRDYMEFVEQSVLTKQIRDIVGKEIDIVYEATEQVTINACSQTGNCDPIQGGVKITVDGIFGDTCSSGFQAEYDGYEGFITAGHCGEENDDVGQPSGWWWDDLGLFYEHHYETNSKCDCGFVKSDESVSDKIYSNINPTGTASVQVNDWVVMEGYVTKGESGQVTDDSTNVSVSGTLILDMVQANYDSSDGDSGAPVYKSGSSPKLLGIHSADDGVTYTYYSKATNADDEFPGLTWDFS